MIRCRPIGNSPCGQMRCICPTRLTAVGGFVRGTIFILGGSAARKRSPRHAGVSAPQPHRRIPSKPAHCSQNSATLSLRFSRGVSRQARLSSIVNRKSSMIWIVNDLLHRRFPGNRCSMWSIFFPLFLLFCPVTSARRYFYEFLSGEFPFLCEPESL